MASPLSPKWQELAKIKPNNITFNNKDDVDRNEDLGSKYADVRTVHAYAAHLYAK